MTQSPPLFEMIFRACEKAGASVVLIGGQAVALRGYQRMTLDVDFMITEEDYEKLKPVLCAGDYREVVRSDVAAKLRSASESLMDIDFLFVSADTFKGVQQEAGEETVQGFPFRVPKPEHLIALKLHAIKQQPAKRELKDLNDIVELIRANRLNALEEGFKSLCLKFGTQEIYAKILRYTRGENQNG